MSKNKNLVCGVGINDADYPVYIQALIGGRNKILWTCPFYQKWHDMMKRCYSAALQSKRPTYIGCHVVNEWLAFSVFRLWMKSQPWEGNNLDKDILCPGNKVYGPDTCVFVSGALNTFLIDSGATRGEWPVGVSWYKPSAKFRAQCRNPFTRKSESIGYFDRQDSAHEAWRARKHELACIYADQQTDPRIAAALRKRYDLTQAAVKGASVN